MILERPEHENVGDGKQKKQWREFESAREFARRLGLKSEKGWREYCRLGRRPKDIPSAPHLAYKSEWRGMGDWLGTGTIRTQDRAYRSFEEARGFVKKLGLRNINEWRSYLKSGEKPDDIPYNPSWVYRSNWLGYGDWLGTGNIRAGYRAYRSFEEARGFVRNLKLKNLGEWCKYYKSGEKPDDIPSSPRTVYKDKWINLGDWLGTYTISSHNREYRSFEEAREFSRSLGLKDQVAWYLYCGSGKRPNDIPYNVRSVYKSEWRGWADWLGYTAKHWRKPALLALLQDLHSSIPQLNERELYMILQRQGALHGLCLAMGTRSPQILLRELKKNEQLVEAELTKVPEEILEAEEEDVQYPPELPNDIPLPIENPIASINQQEQASMSSYTPLPTTPVHYEIPSPIYQAPKKEAQESSDIPSFPDIPLPIAPIPAKETTFTPSIPCPPLPVDEPEEEAKPPVKSLRPIEQPIQPAVTKESLHVADKLQEDLSGGLDEDLAETLVTNRINDLWEVYMNDGNKAVNELLNEHGGHYFKQIKKRFNSERRAVNALPVPEGWSFRDDKGKHCKPNRMQRRIAWLVQKKRRVGNWSGVGAGKTLSAILASRVIDAKVTLIITNNATVQQWHDNIINAYPDSIVHTEISDSLKLSPDKHSFVVINYEKFQLDSRDHNRDMLLGLHPDFIVFDEVQLVKHRYIEEEESHRREALKELVNKSAEQNPSLHVLGMSATPVINNLQEAKGLLEIVTGENISVGTMPTVNNALEMHKLFMQYGTRYRPRHTSNVEQETPLKPHVIKNVRNDLLDDLIDAQGSVLSTEQALLSAKLDLARPYFQKGTVIYTHYVDGIIKPTREYLEDMGLKVGLYTGSDKSGLGHFLREEIDILLGSSTVGTGLDGLQMVSSRLVPISLPWTFAEWEQLIGRLWRKGQTKQVEVIVPQISLDYKGDIWSWDEWRLALIEHKRSLADCVLDGMVPDSMRMSQQELLKQSRETLKKWIDRVQQFEKAQ